MRLLAFAAVTLLAMIAYLLFIELAGRRRDVRARAAWLHRWTGRALRLMGVTIHASGELPVPGLVASNHLGYLDVFVLSAVTPLVFVSKSEVARWPVAGWLSRMAGTVFIDRTRRTDVLRVGQALVPLVAAGQPVVVFLEGTSTGGDRVLPFLPSLLQPAVAESWTVTPVAVRYEAEGGSAADEVCYWRDMVFLPHFLHLLGLPRIDAHVTFGAARPPGLNRGDLSRALHADVCALLGTSAEGPASSA